MVKDLEKQYMQEQLWRAGRPGPKVVGIDEISIKKRHTYRIVVSDLVRKRPIWFGARIAQHSMHSMPRWCTLVSHLESISHRPWERRV